MAYIYANLATQKLYTDQRILTQLTNDDDSIDITDFTLIDEDILEAAENSAAATIDNHLRWLYTVPLSGTDLTDEIKELCSRLTQCYLWSRRGYETDIITTLRVDTLDRLARLSASKVEVREGKAVAKTPVER